MIRLPNYFSGNNFTYKILSESLINFSVLYADRERLPQEIIKQIREVKLFFITFSDMSSTINEKDQISYREIIFKIPIIFNNRKYVFPVVSYVSNQYSYLRGSYLGFYKKTLYEYSKTNDHINFSDENLIQLRIPQKKNILEQGILTDSDLTSPFLLYRSSTIFDPNECLCELITKNYECSYSESFRITPVSVGTLLGVEIIANQLYKSTDKFILEGIKEVT